MSQNPHTMRPHLSANGRTTSPEIALTDADREALRRAVLALEGPSYVARLSILAGRPINFLGQALPRVASDLISRADTSGTHSSPALCAPDHPEGGQGPGDRHP
jgi:hypothetical protein